MSGQAHEYRSLVLRFAVADDDMQDRLDVELGVLGREGWDVVGFTTEAVPDAVAPCVLHTFVFRRLRMAGPRGGS